VDILVRFAMSDEKDIVETWRMIEKACVTCDLVADQRDDPGEGFNPGASDKELDRLQRALGLPLPEQLRFSLRVHNGVDEHTQHVGKTIGHEDYSTRQIAQAGYVPGCRMPIRF